jgi:arylamine N-acetyltransferase
VLDHFGIVPRRADRDLLAELGHAFSALPYENLTKLVKKHRCPPGPLRRRAPREVIEDHAALGSGGTCFALTELFASVLKRVGLHSHPVLCRTRQRPDGHCALLVQVGDAPCLIDPGYLIHEPMPLTGDDRTGPVRLEVVAEGALDLYTYGRWRYRVDLAPAPRDRFLAAWDASFDWSMMRGVHLCTADTEGYTYLNGSKLCQRGGGRSGSLNLRGREAEELHCRYGLDPDLVATAYRLVASQRDRARR